MHNEAICVGFQAQYFREDAEHGGGRCEAGTLPESNVIRYVATQPIADHRCEECSRVLPSLVSPFVIIHHPREVAVPIRNASFFVPVRFFVSLRCFFFVCFVQYVLTDGKDEEHLSRGVYDTYTNTSLRQASHSCYRAIDVHEAGADALGDRQQDGSGWGSRSKALATAIA